MSLEDLLPNPFVTVVDAFENEQLIGVNIVVPVRGEGLKVTSFKLSDDPGLCETLRKIRTADGTVELDLDEGQLQALADCGFLVPPSAVPHDVRYHCTMQDVPQLRQLPPGPLRLNSTLRLSPGGEREETDELPTEAWMLPGSPMAWLRDPGTQFVVPYWLQSQELESLQRMQDGADPAVAADGELLRRLVGAGLVVPEAASPEPALRWAGPRGPKQLAERGYVLLRDLVPPAHLRAMRRYYGGLLREGMLRWGDDQVPRRFNVHNEGCARYWNEQLAPVVAYLAGEPVKASYAYMAVYQPGAVLHRHVDRAQCEFSVSFLVDYSPEPETVSDWPLYLDLPGPVPETVAVHFAIGDGLVYRGRTLAHYRDVLPPGRQSSHIFFHYVGAEFGGPLT